MQYDKKEYNPEEHDKFMAIVVKQPFASDLVTVGYMESKGTTYGVKSIEVRGCNTSYRGPVLICSTENPKIPGYECGATLGIAELYDVKHVSYFTDYHWDRTRVPKNKRKSINSGYGWMLRNPKRVIEYPVKVKRGIRYIVFEKGEILKYPNSVELDRKGWEIIKKQIRNGKQTDENR